MPVTDDHTVTADGLYAFQKGEGDRPPIVFLHGFAAGSFVWARLQDAFSTDRKTLAYDLPGHGGSASSSGVGGGGSMAKALIADLDRRGVERAHLVGHSMGGAAAALVAARQPKRAASLTLLAPGGFGSEINHRLLRRYALADNEQDLIACLEEMFGWNATIPPELVSRLTILRKADGAADRMKQIMRSIFVEDDGGISQGVIRREMFAALDMPVKVLWGTQDRVLPTRQSHRLPPLFAAHVFENTGHMLIEERPYEVEILIRQNIASVGD
ncbi:MAG: dihydrolipoamide acetyltransferase [Rhizobiaceae bacterium MnEN-MB40S]|nr:MAG: dihydrolipoamide acetyltransferase [Rhizobiaceae bacterium MnEN-MB40S]